MSIRLSVLGQIRTSHMQGSFSFIQYNASHEHNFPYGCTKAWADTCSRSNEQTGRFKAPMTNFIHSFISQILLKSPLLELGFSELVQKFGTY